MAPNLALFLCVGFTLALFVLDAKRSEASSTALWIPTLWMLICGSRMVSLWFNMGATQVSAQTYADGSPLDRNVFLVLIIAALVVVVQRGVGISRLVQNNGWMCLFLLYCAISIAWSDFPGVSFKRYVKEIGNLLMVLIVLSERDPVQAIRTLVKRCAYVLIPLSIVLYRYFPNLGRSYGRWSGMMAVTGVTNNKNSLGVLCAICGIGLFWNLLSMWRNKDLGLDKKRFLVQGLAFGLTLWVLMLAKSATSTGCLLVGICILTVMRLKAVRRNVTLYALAAVCVIGAIYVTGDLVALTASTMGRDETLTGRTEIWHKTIEMMDSPVIGCGYGSFWLGERMETIWRDYTWNPTETHNGYIETYLDLGFVGVALLIGLIVSTFRSVLKVVKSDFEYGVIRLTLLTVAVLYNVTESAFRPGLLMYFFFVLAVVRLPRPIRMNDKKLRHVAQEHAPRETIEAPVAHIISTSTLWHETSRTLREA